MTKHTHPSCQIALIVGHEDRTEPFGLCTDKMPLEPQCKAAGLPFSMDVWIWPRCSSADDILSVPVKCTCRVGKRGGGSPGSSEVVQLQQGLVQDLVDAHVLLFGTGQTLCEHKGHPASHEHRHGTSISRHSWTHAHRWAAQYGNSLRGASLSSSPSTSRDEPRPSAIPGCQAVPAVQLLPPPTAPCCP